MTQQRIFYLNTKNLVSGVHYYYEIVLTDSVTIIFFDFGTKYSGRERQRWPVAIPAILWASFNTGGAASAPVVDNGVALCGNRLRRRAGNPRGGHRTTSQVPVVAESAIRPGGESVRCDQRLR